VAKESHTLHNNIGISRRNTWESSVTGDKELLDRGVCFKLHKTTSEWNTPQVPQRSSLH